MDDERQGLGDAVRTKRLVDVAHEGHQTVVVRPDPSEEVVWELLEHVPATVLVQGGHEAHVVAVLELALLEQHANPTLDPRPEIVGMPLRDDEAPTLAEPREAVFEDGLDEAILRAEVVLHRRVVAVPGSRADLSQRHALDAALGEQPLRDEDDLLLGRRGDHRHGVDHSTLDSESQLS